MKKIIALILSVIIALSLCACGETEKKDEKVTVSLLTKITIASTHDGETTKIDGVLEYDENYNLLSTKMKHGDTLVNETTYDKDISRPLVEKAYDENGKLEYRWEYTYDKDGNVLTEINYNEKGEEQTKYVFTYDKDGNMLTEQVYYDGELDNEHRYTYNSDGKVLTEQSYGGTELLYETTYTYDNHGNVLSFVTSDDVDERETTYENTYENGKLTEVKGYEDGAQFHYAKYDADGNEILVITYSDGEEFSREETTYENGKLVKQVSYTLGEEDYRRENTYNADGKLTERIECYSDEYEYKTTYTYNDKGDLASMSSYDDGELVSEYTTIYETVTVSKAQAKNIQKVIDSLGEG